MEGLSTNVPRRSSRIQPVWTLRPVLGNDAYVPLHAVVYDWNVAGKVHVTLQLSTLGDMQGLPSSGGRGTLGFPVQSLLNIDIHEENPTLAKLGIGMLPAYLGKETRKCTIVHVLSALCTSHTLTHSGLGRGCVPAGLSCCNDFHGSHVTSMEVKSLRWRPKYRSHGSDSHK